MSVWVCVCQSKTETQKDGEFKKMYYAFSFSSLYENLFVNVRIFN